MVLLSVSLIAFGAIFFSANQSLISQVGQNDLSSFKHETTQLPVLVDQLRFEGDSDWLVLTHLPNASTDRLDVNGRSVVFSTPNDSWSFNVGQVVKTNLDQPLYPSLYVHISDGLLHVDSLPFTVSTPRLSAFLLKGQPQAVSFWIRNVSRQKLDFNVALPIIDSVSISSNDASFSLSPGETKTIAIAVQPLPFVSGAYLKPISISWTASSVASVLSLPFLLSITDQSYLLFYPPVTSVTGEAGTLFDSLFTVCNTSAESFSNVSFSVSSSLSSTVTPPVSISTISPGCVDTHWGIQFPSNPQTQNGFIQVQSGSMTNAASLTIISGGS